ncbi:PEP-CTERM protein-sorting domain-containing protein [Nitrosospira sp. Nsp14]|uniref:HAF repeat-containing PEP-CTERM protein n=1 Tax=Nitrosospira sp. Nsp14 TaxID=1855333 RepID=UPI0008EF89A8|nr:HAF repeat-containing PEP-CTERM protein [Nitrosospira sp. Nsp14]SFH44412.1 PEP-CTERM protein-sorting domain-containing protein [Nitrosospira sp. Nsp14]
MKITPGFKIRAFILAAAFSACLGFGTNASAQVGLSYLVDLNSKTATELGMGGDNSVSGINDAGQVVGDSRTAGGIFHAFITGPNGTGMMDLNSLVDLPGGVVLTSASAINNAGQVIAIGAIIPEPEIYALFLAGLGLVGFIAGRKEDEGDSL